MNDIADIAVVGAGPAGLAAAVTAAEHGMNVVLIDAGGQPGGQYWRHPDERYIVDDESHGHHGWKVFTSLRNRLHIQQQHGRINYQTRRQVWFVEQPENDEAPWQLHTISTVEGIITDSMPNRIRARRLVLCPGGYDRQLPIPGWDLPGAMAAGGVQSLIKGNRTIAGRRAVVAGTGPFLLPVAVGLADAGVEVVAICEAGNLTGWAKNFLGAAQMPSKAAEGAEYVSALLKHRIPYKPLTVVSSIEGDGQVQAATLSRVNVDGSLRAGTEQSVEVDLVATGWGFTPSMELIQAVGAETKLDVDESLVAVVDDLQHSSVDRVYIAGEATGVGGAVMAVAEGELAALSATKDSRIQVPTSRINKLKGIIRRSAAFAKSMHSAHPVPDKWMDWITDDTIICRCEEVVYSEVCHARDDLAASEARALKLLARPGMGWCQGRICGFACAKISAHSEQRELVPMDLAQISKRHLTTPVNLSDLAGT